MRCGPLRDVEYRHRANHPRPAGDPECPGHGLPSMPPSTRLSTGGARRRREGRPVANGPHFSSGHDLREADGLTATCAGTRRSAPGVRLRRPGAGGAARPRAGDIYVGFCERWRNIPKPTIALVQGKGVSPAMRC